MEGLKRKGIAAFVLSALVALVIGGGLAFNPGLATAAADIDSGEGGNAVLSVSKIDDKGAAVKGATLEVQNASGAVVATWETDGSEQKITGLTSGVTYTVHESVAPAGYEIAQDIRVQIPSESPSTVPAAVARENSGYDEGLRIGSQVVYCLDRPTFRALPGSAYAQELSSVDANTNNLNNKQNIIDNKSKILAALAIGYPNNITGFQERYNLSNADFNRVTQDAIWNIVNGIEPGTSDSTWEDLNVHKSAAYAVYYQAFKDEIDTFDSSGYDATLYWNNNAQPVIGTNLGTPPNSSGAISVSMVDRKVATDTELTVEKKWVDENGAATDAPSNASVTFALNKDGVKVDEVTLSAATGWSHTFINLDADATYTAEEISVTDGYEQDGQATKETVAKSMNSSTASKELVAVTPQVGKSYVINALRFDDTRNEDRVVTLSDQNGLVAKEEALTVGNIPDSHLWTLVDAGNGKVYLTNKASGQTMVMGQINGSAASSATVELAPQNSGIAFTIEPNNDAANTSTLAYDRTWMGLQTRFDLALGQQSVFLITKTDNDYAKHAQSTRVIFYEEQDVTVTNTTQYATDKYTFTNKKTASNNETVDVSGTKTWADEDDKDKLRPAEIEVQLLADDKAVDGKTAKATAAGGWTYSFTGLPKFAADGKTEIVYSVEETTVPTGYTATVAGMNITNTHKPETVEYKGSLQTTVKGSVGGAAAVLYAGEDGTLTTDVVDTITYSGLQEGATYTVTGTLMENGTKEVATVTKDFKAEGASGTWEITFSNVTLEVGKSYVVFEEAVNKEVPEDTAEHKNPDDQAQTVIVEEKPEAGDLATTVEGATASAAANLSAEDAAAKTSLTDKIDYKNLTPGATYTVSGRLMEDGTDEVAVATEELKASDTGSGTWEITFEFPAGTLKPDTKYVVFESATNKDDNTEEVHEHANPNDVSQTVVVKAEEAPVAKQGSIGTTVEGASDSSAANLSAEDAAAKTSLVDVIDYENLVPGATYTVSGRLMENGATEVASATAQCVASDTGSGSWEITFEFPAGTLKPDTKYVVFEKAESPDDANGPYNHADANDVSQTIVVEEKEPSNSGNGDNGDNGDNGETGNGETGNGETGNGETGNGNTGGGDNTTSSEESGTGSGDNANSGDNTNSGDNKNGGSEEGDDATAGRTVQTPSTVTARNLSATPTTSTSRSASTTPTAATTTTARSGARTGDGMDGVVALLSMAMAVSVGAMAYTRKRRSEQE